MLLRLPLPTHMRLCSPVPLPACSKFANLLCTRCEQGLRTQIYQVKSHTGIHGNEAADHQAAKDPSQVLLTDNSDNNYFGNIFWPGKINEDNQEGAPYIMTL